MIDHITKLAQDMEAAAERPEIKGGNVDFLLKSAAMHLRDQQAEIESLNARIRDMSWDNEHLRSLYDDRRGYDGYR